MYYEKSVLNGLIGGSFKSIFGVVADSPISVFSLPERSVKVGKSTLLAILLIVSTVMGGIVGSATPAEAQTGYKLCYAKSGYIRYTKIKDNEVCSTFKWEVVKDTLIDFKNVPTLYRDGAYRDLSDCENFTRWVLESDEYKGANVCYVMDSGKFYQSSVLQDRMKLDSPVTGENAGRRMCYRPREGKIALYIVADSNRYNCSDYYDGIDERYRDVPTLNRGGSPVNLSVCENFTFWVLGIKTPGVSPCNEYATGDGGDFYHLTDTLKR